MERFAVLDHGCKVNRYDGEALRADLRRAGLAETAEVALADVLVVHACAVTDRAVAKGRRALRGLRRKNAGARLVVTGCMTESDRAAYERVEPGLIVLPARERERLPEVLLGAAAFRSRAPDDALGFGDRTRAFVKVVDGCDARCAFCVIPGIRGAIRSRPRAAIQDEVRAQVARGLREVVVCGIHLGHYGHDTGDSLLALLETLDSLDTERSGEFRVRLGSLEATEVGAPLARFLASSRRVVPHLHVPLQSGDDAVLRAMRRAYTASGFLRRIDALRAQVPGLALTTDVIVGFPGEDEAAFANTLALLERTGCSKVHAFPYSPRAGTEAAELPRRVEPRVLRERVARLLALDRRLAAAADASRFGTRARVLVQSRGGAPSFGLCEAYRTVRLPGAHAWREFVDCTIVGRSGSDLLGREVA